MRYGGLLFPPSYSRDQYTSAEEAEMEWQQREEERRLDAEHLRTQRALGSDPEGS